MATISPNSPQGAILRPSYSCTRCASRKVKCDRQRPCGACAKHKVDCVFNPPQVPGEKRKRANSSEQDLISRLRHYERLLQERGIAPPQTEALTSEQAPSMTRTQVVSGRGRYKLVDNTLWTRVVEELQNSDDVLDDTSQPSNQRDEDPNTSGSMFVLRQHISDNTKLKHPSPVDIRWLWMVFQDRVDPLTKVIHVPTFRPIFEKTSIDFAAFPIGIEALAFSIYAAAVMSLDDETCEERFGESRKSVLDTFTAATESSLSEANFMGTNSLIVLQALVLHLIAIRDRGEPRAVWTLTGVAVRLAQGMGLDRDGTFLGLPPFETEIRRRTWWMLRWHDFRAAELCGFAKFRDLDTNDETTLWPSSVNDDQLYPGMTEFPLESKGATDMMFVSLRNELAKFTSGRVASNRRQRKPPNQWELRASGREKAEIDEACKQLEETIETKYIRYCDPSHPLHLMVMLMGRFALNVVRFLVHHPRGWVDIQKVPLSERQMVWETSIKQLEQHHMMQTNPMLRKFSWHAAYYQQWHALIHVLDTLRAEPLIQDAKKAWQIIGEIYASNPDMIRDRKKPIHVAVGNLCLKAYAQQERTVELQDRRTRIAPEYIVQLREQSAVSKSHKQGEKDKRDEAGQSGSTDAAMMQAKAVETPNLNDTRGNPSFSAVSDMDSFNDMLWFETMSTLDPDVILGTTDERGSSLDITWDQWDVWASQQRPT